MKKFFYIILTCTFITSCGQYHKALKGSDIGVKFKEGEKQYNAGKYAKANKLFEQILPSYRGKPQAEKLTFLHAMASYNLEDWYLASYQFERFVSSYPNSEKAEEASFLGAKSSYMLSPVYSKDQTETKESIEKLQGFINLYPESEYLAEANKLVKELDFKLEKKAFDIAKQYNTIAGYTADYNAPIEAIDKFIFDFPGSTFREEALFIKFDSAYKLAMNSVYYKKQQRLEDAKTYFNSFKSSYANSEFMEEAEKMNEDIERELKNYSTKS